MNIIGIITEFNPFHNGHKYFIDKIKEKYPNSLIICITSSSFSQRGELSILNKWEKTEVALNNNIDLVIELPYFFTVQSADIFAHASMQLLNALKIDTLVFGSESNNIDELTKTANAFKSDDIEIKKLITSGLNYPTIISKINEIKNSPNDILGFCYIKEILKNNYQIKPVSIKRTNDYHNNTKNDKIISASNIRNKFFSNKNIKKYVPNNSFSFLKNKVIDENKYIDLLKYKISIDNNLKNYLDVNEGIENRIIKYLYSCTTLDDAIKSIKSKRYTYAKISRMLNHILIGLSKKDAHTIKDIEYIRVLGFNKNGRAYLNKIKKELKYPLIQKYEAKYVTSEYELKATKVYSIITGNENVLSAEYKKRCIIKNDE